MKDMEKQKYEDMEAWQAAMELVQEVYGLTEKFPPEEKAGLAGHMRVAAIKIPSKIAASTGYKNFKISFWYLAFNSVPQSDQRGKAELKARRNAPLPHPTSSSLPVSGSSTCERNRCNRRAERELTAPDA